MIIVDENNIGVGTMIMQEDISELQEVQHTRRSEVYLYGIRLAFRNNIWVNLIPNKSGIVRIVKDTEYLRKKSKLQVWMFA